MSSPTARPGAVNGIGRAVSTATVLGLVDLPRPERGSVRRHDDGNDAAQADLRPDRRQLLGRQPRARASGRGRNPGRARSGRELKLDSWSVRRRGSPRMPTAIGPGDPPTAACSARRRRRPGRHRDHDGRRTDRRAGRPAARARHRPDRDPRAASTAGHRRRDQGGVRSGCRRSSTGRDRRSARPSEPRSVRLVVRTPAHRLRRSRRDADAAEPRRSAPSRRRAVQRRRGLSDARTPTRAGGDLAGTGRARRGSGVVEIAARCRYRAAAGADAEPGSRPAPVSLCPTRAFASAVNALEFGERRHVSPMRRTACRPTPRAPTWSPRTSIGTRT